MYMLQLRGSLLNRPVMSLRTGGVVATTTTAIINPNNLKIEGFYCQDAFDRKKVLVLLAQDIRDILTDGFVVDDHDSLTEPAELIRLKDIISLLFELAGKPILTSSKEKVGKVADYATDMDSLMIMKLYAEQSVFKNLTGGSLVIDRTQIIEITDRKIVIQDLMPGVPATARAAAAPVPTACVGRS